MSEAATLDTWQLPPFFRAVAIDGTKLAKDDRTLPVTFSSETPVLRTFPHDFSDKRVAGKTFHEVLDHSPGACDLSLLAQRAPLLVDHDAKQQAGVILSPSLDETGRVACAQVKFSRSQLGEREFQDVQDGIRTKVSAGYRIQRARIEPAAGADGYPILRALKWQPYEVSTVSLPADGSDRVGFGRAGDITGLSTCTFERAAVDNPGEDMADLENPPKKKDEPVNIEVVRAEERRNELTRANEIRANADHWQKLGFDVTELANKALKEGHSVDDFQRSAFTHAQTTKPIQTARLDVDEKTKRRYSLVRAVSLLSNQKPLDGVELELSREMEKQIGKAPEGFYVPDCLVIDGGAASRGAEVSAALMRALNVSNFSQGGATVQTDVLGGSMIELLRNKQRIRSLGARSMDGLVGNIAIPRQTGAATGYSVAENAALTGSTQAIGQLALTPHRIGAYNDYSKQLLAQSSIDVENFVRQDLMIVLAILSDYYAIAGSGSASQPTGILNTTGIGSVTFGASATWAKIIDFETQVANANADLGALAYLTSPSVRAKLKQITKIASSQYSDFIWEKRAGAAPGDGEINSYLATATKQMQQAGDLVIFGNFADMILAGWAGLDVVIDPYTQATLGLVRITVNQFMDIGIRHSGSFTASTDSGAQ